MSNPTAARRAGHDPSVPAIDQMMRILKFLAASSPGPTKLTEICRKSAIHKSRGYALLHTLQKYSVVTRDPATKAYQMGPGLLPLAKKFLDHLDLRQIAQPA
jgi:DNA-binding IclR family transcriptional regulator